MAYPNKLGNFSVTSARQLTKPFWTGLSLISQNVKPGERAMPVLGGGRKRQLEEDFEPVANDAYEPPGKRARLAPVLPVGPPAPAPVPPALPVPAPPLPPVGSVGVMDVGAAGCNLLFSNAAVNPQPLTYYDLGAPIFWNIGSILPTLQGGPANPAWVGPIMNNAGGNLNVVLSHWHMDHWRLAFLAGLNALAWMDINQPLGGATAAFQAALVNRLAFPGPVIAPFPNYTLYQCVPQPGLPAAAMIDNTGLAMRITTLLPVAGPPPVVPHDIVLTGDANLNSVPAVAYANVTGIGAVHHGSHTHGAANPANLFPVIAAFALQGRIAYSNGVRQTAAGAWVHCYGHPSPLAIPNYAAPAMGWGFPAAPPIPPPPNFHRSTSEGQALNGGMPPPAGARGNIRMGTNAPLGPPYAATAFGAFPNLLQ